MNTQLNRRIASAALIVGFFVLWELLCLAFGIKDIVLPRPSQIIYTLVTRFPAIWPHALKDGMFDIDRALASILEIHGDSVAGDRLDLADSPVGGSRQNDKLSRLECAGDRFRLRRHLGRSLWIYGLKRFLSARALV